MTQLGTELGSRVESQTNNLLNKKGITNNFMIIYDKYFNEQFELHKKINI